MGQKYPYTGQIQGLDASYPMDTMGVIIITLVLAGNSKIWSCVFFFCILHFAGLKSQYTLKLLLGLENKGFYMHKKKLQKCD